MKLPDEFLLDEDREEMDILTKSIETLADCFRYDSESATTEGLRMAAGMFRAGAARLELIADRVESEAENV